ncbi:flagella biosynthesis regulatory protein FliZ [Borrelia venezuelensis]|uniref:flagella biosynthesis regulatory protein FliZ n=1 Tax=Borrelia venezuelensis TaxID=1653839 RepID=UPI001FF6DBD1|nr:flagella biosynthesis regulatory protein FliZ [Borrelia venezuelensis]UPA11962.1 flagella biosynthesis regulatory protein FliZ [Borrelia venezuelensis]
MSRLTLFKFVFLIIFIFFFKNLFAQENEVDLDISSSSLENEVNLPIFEGDKANLNNKDIQNISLFSISDLVTIFLFFLFFLICIFLFKKMILNHKKVKNSYKSNFIRELAFYEIDNKNSVRVINILGNVYVFLVSSNSSILLREIKQGEELDNLKFELDKAKSLSDITSFKSIFNKILRKNKKDELSFDKTEYAALENDIETSLKSKQDRLKKF